MTITMYIVNFIEQQLPMQTLTMVGLYTIDPRAFLDASDMFVGPEG